MVVVRVVINEVKACVVLFKFSDVNFVVVIFKDLLVMFFLISTISPLVNCNYSFFILNNNCFDFVFNNDFIINNSDEENTCFLIYGIINFNNFKKLLIKCNSIIIPKINQINQINEINEINEIKNVDKINNSLNNLNKKNNSFENNDCLNIINQNNKSFEKNNIDYYCFFRFFCTSRLCSTCLRPWVLSRPASSFLS